MSGQIAIIPLSHDISGRFIWSFHSHNFYALKTQTKWQEDKWQQSTSSIFTATNKVCLCLSEVLFPPFRFQGTKHIFAHTYKWPHIHDQLYGCGWVFLCMFVREGPAVSSHTLHIPTYTPVHSTHKLPSFPFRKSLKDFQREAAYHRGNVLFLTTSVLYDSQSPWRPKT